MCYAFLTLLRVFTRWINGKVGCQKFKLMTITVPYLKQVWFLTTTTTTKEKELVLFACAIIGAESFISSSYGIINPHLQCLHQYMSNLILTALTGTDGAVVVDLLGGTNWSTNWKPPYPTRWPIQHLTS